MRTNANRRTKKAKGLDTHVIRILNDAHAEFLGFLRRKLRNRADADEVMQEFYLRVVQYASGLRKEESIRIWLRRVLRSVLITHVRRRHARERAEADFARKDIVITAQDEDLDRSVCRCMERLLPALNPEYADILRRIDLLSEPREAVAGALRLSANTVTVRLHRARQALRRTN